MSAPSRSILCTDASVAVKWLFLEEHTDRANALLARAGASGDPVVAPPLFWYEVTNAIRRRMIRDRVPSDVANERLSRFLGMRIEIGPALHQRALAIADLYGLAAA